MNSTSQLENIISQEVPSASEQEVKQFTILLMSLINNNNTTDIQKSEFNKASTLPNILKSLAGKKVEIQDKVLSFGEGSQLGDLTVRDVVGGNISTFNINIFYAHKNDGGLPINKTPTMPARCPYPGMTPFKTEDALFFYGREKEVQRMLQHFRHQRCLFVIGASGSGKSSLILAGFIPQLKKSSYFPPNYWKILYMRPTSQPYEVLAQLLDFREGGLNEAIEIFLHSSPPGGHLLFIVDQFEEAFAQTGQKEQTDFFNALKTIRTNKQCALLVSMRADFYQDLMMSSLWPVTANQRLELTTLRAKELREAIQKPANDVGVFLEPKLLEHLLIDASNEPGVLPLLQEALVILWGSMSNDTITLKAYEELGTIGVNGIVVAIAAKADATFDDLSEVQQVIARRIFLRLIQFGEGRPDTRRQQPLSSLKSVVDKVDDLHTTIRHLTQSRLITLSGGEANRETLVDVAHEALIEGWPKLQEWLKERRDAEQMRRWLENKALEWIRLGRGKGGLLDSAEFPEAERWMSSYHAVDLGYSVEVLAFVQASNRMIKQLETERKMRFEEETAIVARDNFLAVASHELKTPLTSILGGLQLLLRRAEREGNLNERNQRALKGVLGSAAKLNRLMSDMLDATRIKQGRFNFNANVVNAISLVESVVAQEQTISRQSLFLRNEVNDGQILVMGDELRLEQVLHNLIDNAVRFSTQDSQITVRVFREERFAGIEVHNYGIGIPAASLPFIYDCYYRAPNVEEITSGLGIGLFVVKEILDLLAGGISVSSEENKETIFTIKLPIHFQEPG